MSHTRKILRGSASNILRVILSMLIALVLPPLLVHRLEPPEYSAWVIILQCSGYISLLDFGLQTAVGKFVAEYDATEDRQSSGHILSSSFAILCVCAVAGATALGLIAWRVPQLFHQMPAYLISDVRVGILVVGLSTVIALPFGAFLGVFTGLQRYGFPTALSSATKILSSATLAILLLLNGRLVQLVWVLGTFNLATAAGQFVGWKRYASDRVSFAWKLVNGAAASRLVRYGTVLSIWNFAGLLISGLDIVIVGHFDYANTGYYGIAASVTNFMLLIIGGMFGPILPAVSSLQTAQPGEEIGNLTIKATRYCALLLFLFGLPLAFGAYPLLRLWVGHAYAIRAVPFLEVLILGNVIRQLGYPYSLVVIATGKQYFATISGVVEALVNIAVSIYLVQRMGAVGVAIGTVVGAFVSVGLHVVLSMKYTQSAIAMSRRRFLVQGLLRPSLCLIPSMILVPAWNRFAMLPWSPPYLLFWVVATLWLAWQTGLTGAERVRLVATISRVIGLGYARAT